MLFWSKVVTAAGHEAQFVSVKQFWPAFKIWRIGDRVHPQFAFHTCTTQGKVLCTDAFTTAINPPHFSGKRWSSRVQPTETGSDVWTLFSHRALGSALLTTNTLDIFVVVFYACVTAFSPGDLFSLFVFFKFCICQVLECFINTPPSACGESSVGSHAVFTHWLLLDFYWRYTRGPGRENTVWLRRSESLLL